MVSRRWKRRILEFCLAGLAVHALFDPLAMVLYSGGTSIDEDAEGYSFFENFYSDLGMTQTYGGEANTLSLLLWASVNALNGIALVFFSVIMPSYFTATRLERFSSRVGSICGVLAGISSVGAVIPWDLYLIAHLVFTFGTSALFLLAFAFYSVAMLKNRRIFRPPSIVSPLHIGSRNTNVASSRMTPASTNEATIFIGAYHCRANSAGIRIPLNSQPNRRFIHDANQAVVIRIMYDLGLANNELAMSS